MTPRQARINGVPAWLRLEWLRNRRDPMLPLQARLAISRQTTARLTYMHTRNDKRSPAPARVATERLIGRRRTSTIGRSVSIRQQR